MAGAPSSGDLNRPCGGDAVFLGLAYDAVNEKVLAGISLWPAAPPEPKDLFSPPPPLPGGEEVIAVEYHRKHFKIVSASSMDELVDNLAIQASLRISLGILALEGSASYTRSKACSSSTARVTLHYVNHILSETCRSYPSIDTLNYSLRDLAEKGASHVITSIKYGASADIVFEKHTSSRNEALQIEGSLSVSLGPLIRGEGTVTVDQMQQAAQNGIMMSSETLGMKNLPSLDGMTGEAVLRYVREMGNLTKSDFSNDGKGAPLTMTLTPIKDLYDSAAVLYSSISDNVLEDGVKLLEKLTRLHADLNSYLNRSVLTYFPAFKRELVTMTRGFEDFFREIQSKLLYLLPKIRSGRMPAAFGELTALVRSIEHSPLGPDLFVVTVSELEAKLNQLSTNLSKALALVVPNPAGLDPPAEEPLDTVLSRVAVSAGVKVVHSAPEGPTISTVVAENQLVLFVALADNEWEPKLERINCTTRGWKGLVDLESVKLGNVFDTDAPPLRLPEARRVAPVSPAGLVAVPTDEACTYILAVGESGVGKSSLLQALSGDSRYTVGHGTNGQTVAPTSRDVYDLGAHWFGDGSKGVVKCLDTGGLGDSDGRDVAFLASLGEAMRNFPVDAILDVFRATDIRWSINRQLLFKILRTAFGPVIWKHVAIVLTSWDWSSGVRYTRANLEAKGKAVLDCPNDAEGREQWCFARIEAEALGCRREEIPAETRAAINAIPIFGVDIVSEILPETFPTLPIATRQSLPDLMMAAARNDGLQAVISVPGVTGEAGVTAQTLVQLNNLRTFAERTRTLYPRVGLAAGVVPNQVFVNSLASIIGCQASEQKMRVGYMLEPLLPIVRLRDRPDVMAFIPADGRSWQLRVYNAGVAAVVAGGAGAPTEPPSDSVAPSADEISGWSALPDATLDRVAPEVTDLPAGLTFNKTNGSLSGTPSAAGKVTYLLRCRNIMGWSSFYPLSLDVAPAPIVEGPEPRFLELLRSLKRFVSANSVIPVNQAGPAYVFGDVRSFPELLRNLASNAPVVRSSNLIWIRKGVIVRPTVAELGSPTCPVLSLPLVRQLKLVSPEIIGFDFTVSWKTTNVSNFPCDSDRVSVWSVDGGGHSWRRAPLLVRSRLLDGGKTATVSGLSESSNLGVKVQAKLNAIQLLENLLGPDEDIEDVKVWECPCEALVVGMTIAPPSAVTVSWASECELRIEVQVPPNPITVLPASAPVPSTVNISCEIRYDSGSKSHIVTDAGVSVDDSTTHSFTVDGLDICHGRHTIRAQLLVGSLSGREVSTSIEGLPWPAPTLTIVSTGLYSAKVNIGSNLDDLVRPVPITQNVHACIQDVPGQDGFGNHEFVGLDCSRPYLVWGRITRFGQITESPHLPVEPKGQIRSIFYRSGDSIDRVEVQRSDGSKTIMAGGYGGGFGGASRDSFLLSDGQFITGIGLTSGKDGNCFGVAVHFEVVGGRTLVAASEIWRLHNLMLPLLQRTVPLSQGLLNLQWTKAPAGKHIVDFEIKRNGVGFDRIVYRDL